MKKQKNNLGQVSMVCRGVGSYVGPSDSLKCSRLQTLVSDAAWKRTSDGTSGAISISVSVTSLCLAKHEADGVPRALGSFHPHDAI